MNNLFEKKAGISLIIFTLLLVLTMVMHPAGGSVDYLIRTTPLIITTHAIAITSLPFGLMGFWGLTRRIGTDHFWSMLAFSSICLGIIAAMIAAATNGLVMPVFLQGYKDASPETIESIRPILRFSFSINHAFDYVYTGAFLLSILSWSICIIHTRKLPVWIGWSGIVVTLAILGMIITGIAMNSLLGFRIFVSCIVVWIIIVGINLTKNPTNT